MWKKLVLAASLAACSTAYAADELHLYNWNNYLSEDTARQFEKECKCKLVQDYYGDNEEMLAKLAAGAKGYDLVVPTGFAVQTLIGKKAAQPLDKAQLPNLKNLNPGFKGAFYDPQGNYSIPYALTTTVLGYNEDALKKAGVADKANSWALIFDPAVLAKIKGKVTVLDSQRELLGAALMYLGKSANSTDPKDWAAAKDVILKAKPYWAAFNNQSYIKELTVGNIWLVHGFTNDFFQAMHDARAAKRPFTIGYNLQKEGNILGLDSLVILKGARRPDLANQFVNFLLDGKNAADVSNIMGAVNPNTAATPYFRPDIKANKVIMADPARQKLILLKEVPMKARRDLNRTWTSLKLG